MLFYCDCMHAWWCMFALTNRCSTSHSSIFTMYTVVGPQWISRAVDESGLSSTTLDIVQPDLTSTIGEASEQSNSTCKFYSKG